MTIENDNPELLKVIAADNRLKKLLVNYVGKKLNPENDEVNIEMVIDVMAAEFPELLLAVAEENFIRGYQQGLADVDVMGKTALPTPTLVPPVATHTRPSPYGDG